VSKQLFRTAYYDICNTKAKSGQRGGEIVSIFR